MPENPRRDRPPRAPTVRDAADAFEARRRPHALHLAERRHEGEIAARPDVGSAERHQEVDVGTPRTDASELDQRGAGRVVIQFGQSARIKLAGNNRMREPAHI
jgi:hypothetical protein